MFTVRRCLAMDQVEIAEREYALIEYRTGEPA